jgi:hypothetical protein
MLSVLPASAATIQIVPGTTMQMDTPPGQCLVEPTAHQNDAAYFAAMQQLYTGTNSLLAYFIPCEALASMRQGVAVPMSQWTIVLLPLSNGQVMPATGYTRSQAIDELAQLAVTTDTQGYLQGHKGSIEDRINAVTRQQGYQMNQLTSLGVLARDGNGLYSGLMMTQMLGGETQTIACVFAMTLINGYILTVNAYRPFEGAQTYAALLADMQARTAALVSANGGAEIAAPSQPSTPLGFATPTPIAEGSGSSGTGGDVMLVIALVVAVMGVGGAVGFFLTRKKAG